jgi:DNA-binding XRE family transcriptional regulator
MPFKKVNIKEEIAIEVKNDPEFEYYLGIAELEYQFIKKIKEIREEADISQNELAKEAHVTQQMISRLEKSSKTPTLTTLIKILDSLGYELDIKKKVG